MSLELHGGEFPNPVLHEILVNRSVEHPGGRRVPLKANVSPENSRALYRLVKERAPRFSVEIGMGHRVSTLSILSALAENGAGHLVSIDPYHGWPSGREIALHQVRRAGLERMHRHLQRPSHDGISELLREGERGDLVYIDGNHRFEFVMVDWFLADRLLTPGGIVGFNDCGWRTVHSVVRYLLRSGRYREIDVGLPRRFHGANILKSAVKWLEGRSTRDRYFEKLMDVDPHVEAESPPHMIFWI